MQRIEYVKASEFPERLTLLRLLEAEFVVSAYIVNDNKVCLIDHKDLGLWLPPGGHPKVGEDPLTALYREVLEETGLAVEIVYSGDLFCDQRDVLQVPPPRVLQYEVIREAGGNAHLHVNLAFFCRVTGPDVLTPSEEGTPQWLEMNDLDTLERLLPHTRLNAISAVRELRNIVPRSLKLEKNRILVPIGGRCPYECSYCYTKRHDVYSGEVDPARTQRMVEQITKGCTTPPTAQIGYDNDPFWDPETGLDLLVRLSWLPVHVGFSTKAFITEELAERISVVARIKRERGLVLSALVTLTSIASAVRLEPKAPSPAERLQTIRNLANAGIPVMVNLRPVLPDEVSICEYRELIGAAKASGAQGIVLGAFWTDPEGIVIGSLQKPKSQPTHSMVPWAPHGLPWDRYEDSDFMDRIRGFAIEQGLRVFDSSADAVESLIGNTEV